jgi:hypothetical protein
MVGGAVEEVEKEEVDVGILFGPGKIADILGWSVCSKRPREERRGRTFTRGITYHFSSEGWREGPSLEYALEYRTLSVQDLSGPGRSKISFDNMPIEKIYIFPISNKVEFLGPQVKVVVTPKSIDIELENGNWSAKQEG